MKKIISLALAALLVFAVIPLSASAADINSNITSNTTLSGTNNIVADITISGVLTIPAGATLNIAAGVTITVTGAVNNYGTIKNAGTIFNKGNIINGQDGVVKHLVNIPGTPAGLTEKYDVLLSPESNTVIFDNGLYEYYSNISASGYSDYVDDGDVIYFTLNFKEAKVDPALFEVSAGGQRVLRDRGVYVLNVGQAITVTYGAYNEAELLKQIKIALPSGDGYRVVAFGTSTEQAVQDAIDFVWVDYGSTLSFRVEVFEGWENSDYVVTIGGLDPTKQPVDSYITGPDEFNYYEIRNINDVQGAAGAYEINVAGVVSDDMQNLVQTVMNFIKKIFSTFSDIFKSFAEIFGFDTGNLVPMG